MASAVLFGRGGQCSLAQVPCLMPSGVTGKFKACVLPADTRLPVAVDVFSFSSWAHGGDPVVERGVMVAGDDLLPLFGEAAIARHLKWEFPHLYMVLRAVGVGEDRAGSEDEAGIPVQRALLDTYQEVVDSVTAHDPHGLCGLHGLRYGAHPMVQAGALARSRAVTYPALEVIRRSFERLNHVDLLVGKALATRLIERATPGVSMGAVYRYTGYGSSDGSGNGGAVRAPSGAVATPVVRAPASKRPRPAGRSPYGQHDEREPAPLVVEPGAAPLELRVVGGFSPGVSFRSPPSKTVQRGGGGGSSVAPPPIGARSPGAAVAASPFGGRSARWTRPLQLEAVAPVAAVAAAVTDPEVELETQLPTSPGSPALFGPAVPPCRPPPSPYPSPVTHRGAVVRTPLCNTEVATEPEPEPEAIRGGGDAGRVGCGGGPLQRPAPCPVGDADSPLPDRDPFGMD
jgi:hypothetical protein